MVLVSSSIQHARWISKVSASGLRRHPRCSTSSATCPAKDLVLDPLLLTASLNANDTGPVHQLQREFSRRRRYLQHLLVDEGPPDDCSKNLYRLHLQVDQHIYLVATKQVESPPMSMQESFCPEQLFFHDGGADGTVVHEFLEEDDSGEEYLSILETDDMLLLSEDSFSLLSLVSAFQAAEGAGLTEQNSWDLIMRNCATFILSMMDQLQIDADEDVIAFTANRLHEHGVGTWLKDSPSVDNLLEYAADVLLPDPLRAEQEQDPHAILLYHLTSKYVQDHLTRSRAKQEAKTRGLEQLKDMRNGQLEQNRELGKKKDKSAKKKDKSAKKKSSKKDKKGDNNSVTAEEGVATGSCQLQQFLPQDEDETYMVDVLFRMAEPGDVNFRVYCGDETFTPFFVGFELCENPGASAMVSDPIFGDEPGVVQGSFSFDFEPTNTTTDFSLFLIFICNDGLNYQVEEEGTTAGVESANVLEISCFNEGQDIGTDPDAVVADLTATVPLTDEDPTVVAQQVNAATASVDCNGLCGGGVGTMFRMECARLVCVNEE